MALPVNERQAATISPEAAAFLWNQPSLSGPHSLYADTGEIRVSRWLGVFDVGTVINAKTAASQLRGGIVMGIGMALSEQTLIDPRTGRITNPSLSEYYIPV